MKRDTYENENDKGKELSFQLGTYQKLKGALLVPKKGHLLDIKKGTYENRKWILIAKENGNLSLEKGHVSK